MADSHSVDSKKEQDADISVDNICCSKIFIKQESAKNDAVELDDMVDKSSADSNVEQSVTTSVNNFCYEKLQSKLIIQSN